MKLYILTIDSDDRYTATLHATEAEAYAALEEENDDLNLTGHNLVEWLQDHGVEVNITETELPEPDEPAAPEGVFVTIDARYGGDAIIVNTRYHGDAYTADEARQLARQLDYHASTLERNQADAAYAAHTKEV